MGPFNGFIGIHGTICGHLRLFQDNSRYEDHVLGASNILRLIVFLGLYWGPLIGETCILRTRARTRKWKLGLRRGVHGLRYIMWRFRDA